MQNERVKTQIIKLIKAINRADFDEEMKNLAALEKLLVDLESGSISMQETIDKLKHLVHHYEKMIDLQRIEPEIKDIQEFLDKNG